MSGHLELKRGLAALGLSCNDAVQQQMIDYLSLLDKWNKVYNLTAIRDPQQMVSHHILDSLAPLPYLWPGRWLDVGCGAGLPGIILAMARPDWDFVLLDSNSKKIGFVRQAIIELGVKNVSAHCGRVEEFKPVELFDGVISRAFTELGRFVSMTASLAKANGKWVALKGHADNELASLSSEFVVEKCEILDVPGIAASRSLVVAGRKGE